jgi:hypothetical protein
MIDWLSKKQSTVETSVSSAEFCAMKHSITNSHGIHYKLRMMGVRVPHMCMYAFCHQCEQARVDAEEEVELNLLPCSL